MKIEKASVADIAQIRELLTEAELPVEDLQAKRQVFWLIRRNGKIDAACGLEVYDKAALFRSLVVRNECRKQGVGSKLYHHVIQAGTRELGINRFFLLTTTAQAFFSKHNWEEIARNAVPAQIRSSKEFSALCPQSAICMTYTAENSSTARAGKFFQEGFNCAQAVFTGFAADLGLSNEQALRIASGFGAGIRSKGELCGAVSGAYMALGLKYGRHEAADTAAKEKTYLKMKDFDERFIQAHGSLQCRELLGADVSNPKENEKIKNEKLFTQVCPVYVQTAAQLVDELMKNK